MPRYIPPPKRNEKIWFELLPQTRAERRHGRHVYMFRNIQTNQMLYTHYPRIQQKTLQQLPFIGKHSVPPSVRSDLWTAHCRVGPFETAEQGRDALKKLSEFRTLHQLCWNETNPEWRKEPKKTLIRKIMDMRHNAAADLAQVLTMQREMGSDMIKRWEERAQAQDAYLAKYWAKVEATVQTAGPKISEIERQIRELETEQANQSDQSSEINDLTKRIRQLKAEIRRIQGCKRHLKSRDRREAQLEESYRDALVRYEEEMATYEKQAKGDPEAKAKLAALKVPEKEGLDEREYLRAMLNYERLKAKYEEAAKPDPMAEARAALLKVPEKGLNEIYFRPLPMPLKHLPSPFTVTNLKVSWADLRDAQYAEQWPDSVKHENFPEMKVLTVAELKKELENEKKEIVEHPDVIVEKAVLEKRDAMLTKGGLLMKPRPKKQIEAAPPGPKTKPKSKKQKKDDGLMLTV
ncbi:hypothetical protein M011DRAFT_478184 [Sporormia fimetaria CBS 119925]|uniref:Large ribosomal subunit protein mL67 n=1 Tax=Sporormia fimetaria CBS 119925 TaxID=1340428 RepID=A0A6A6V6Q5_9PLEO|nr:hypothetical protein M011DRAFT_478184 [Sporormia fimetaria CBS 119925]